MWIRTSSGNLINLDNVVEVRKSSSVNGPPNKNWKVIAIDFSPEGTFTIASGLTEEKADDVLRLIWRSIPAEDSLDVSMLVKS